MAVPGLAFSNWGSDKPPEVFYPLTSVAPIAPAPNVPPVDRGSAPRSAVATPRSAR